MSLLVHEFKKIFESLPGLYMILTPDMTIMAVSDAYQQASLKERKDMIGKNLFEVFPDNPADINSNGVSNLKSSLDFVISHRKPHEMATQKYDICNADGLFEERFWAPKNTPVLNDKNELRYIVHQVEDITTRHKAHKQLEDLNFQVSQSKEAIFTLDKERKISTWNKGAEKLYGFSSVEATGKDSNELLNTVFGLGEINEILKTINERGYWSGELCRKTKAGGDIFVHSSNTTLRDYEGNIIGYVAVSFDITEQKKLRKQVDHFANIVEQSSEAIFSRGMDRKYISWNKGAEKLFGYTKEEALGKTPVELGLLRFTENEFADIEREVLKTGTWTAENKFYTKNGDFVWGAVTANLLKNEYGNTQSIVFIIKDITARRRLEEYLKSSNDELETTVKEQTKEVMENEIKYRYLFENNPLPMWVVDESSFEFLDVNKRAAQHYGYSREEFLSMTTLDIRSEAEKEAFLKADLSVETNPEIANRKIWEHCKKDGTKILVEISSQQIIFENRKARLILSHDVTEKIKIQEKLASSEKFFRALIENSNDIITLMDGSFKLLYRSPAAARITGWTNEDMIGIDATKNIHPEDQPYATEVVNEIMANPGKTIHGKFRMRHKAGLYLWVEGTFTNLLHDENVKAIVFNFRDVTARVGTEQKLLANESQFRNTLDNMFEGAQIIDFNWLYIYVNDSAAKFGRTKKEELLGNTVMERYPGIEDTDLFKAMECCMNERIAQQIETEFIFPDGTKADFELSIQPVPEGIFILSIDITERKRAEEKVIQSEIKYRSLFYKSPLPKWIFDTKTLRFLDINDAAIKHYGYSREEFLAMTIKDIRPKEELAKLEDDLSKISGDIDTSRGIWRHRKKGGQMIIVELTAHSIEYGVIKARMVVANDITDKIKAEDRLRKNLLEKQLLAQRMSAILNTLPANIALLNEKGIIIDVNDSWKNFADENGFVGSNYCIGDNYIQISKRSFGHEKEEGEKVAKGIKDVLNGAVKEFVLEYDCHSPEIKRWFRMVVSPLEGKAYAGAVVMHIDISELRNMEQERLESRIAEQKKITQAMLQGQEKERNYIGRELHDNINQILAGTKLYLGIAGKKDDAVKELVRYPMALIDNSIDEIRKLCHNLVTPVKNIDLESLVRDLLKKLEDGGFAKTTLSYAIPKGLLSDELKLNIYRIMQEQVNNIYKYSKAKNVNISLQAFDHFVTIIVTDDGKGFDTEMNRSGIGISNMINRVESFNGEISIESSAGNGCTISINIPY